MQCSAVLSAVLKGGNYREDYCNMLHMRLLFKSIQKLQLRQNMAACVVNCVDITTLLHKLHWLSVCFWVQVKMLGAIFKALHVLGSGYLSDCLFPIVFTWPFQSRLGITKIPPTKEWKLVGTRRQAFSVVGPALWNSLALEITMAPTLLALCEALKLGLCVWAWGSRYINGLVSWLRY